MTSSSTSSNWREESSTPKGTLLRLARDDARARPGDDQEPEQERGPDDDQGDHEDALERTPLLLVAGGATHELPGVVDAAGEPERDEQREQHADERGRNAGLDRVRP